MPKRTIEVTISDEDEHAIIRGDGDAISKSGQGVWGMTTEEAIETLESPFFRENNLADENYRIADFIRAQAARIAELEDKLENGDPARMNRP